MAREAQDLRRQLKEAHMSRALVYAAVYEELCARFGAEVAEEVMTSAIYRRGLAIGQRFAEYGPSDLEGLCAAFLDFVPDQRPAVPAGDQALRCRRPRHQVPRLPA